jgi:hypothetical protein
MRMMGDFDGSANALWTLYGKEAKSYDDSRIQTLKDDMDGVLIFVRSYLLFISLTNTIVDPVGPTGWFILRRPYLVHNRQ